MKSISIYIHIPFCVKKCQYCDFLSAPADSRAQEVYLRALKQEIREQAARYREYEVQTVFIGGGTPTAVPCENLCEVLKTVFSFYRMNPHAEISMEANPGTVTKEALLSYRKAGINRISIGLQSADDVELKLLGRIHTYRDFQQTYRWAQEAGFTNINLDIMSALPGQSVENYKKTLETVLSLKPQHISAYSLIVEEGTPFWERELKLPDEDTEYRMYEDTAAILGEYGFHQYEISNYAKKGRECRHNKGYWQRTDYLGFGLGASSLLNHVRFSNTDNMEEYLRNSAFPEKIRRNVEALTREDEMAEFMFLGLRMTEGVSLRGFEEYFGENMENIYGEVLKKHRNLGLLEQKNGRIFLTRRGIHVSNGVMADFLL